MGVVVWLECRNYSCDKSPVLLRELGKSDERRKLRGELREETGLEEEEGEKGNPPNQNKSSPRGLQEQQGLWPRSCRCGTLVGKKSPGTQKSSERNRVLGGIKKAGRQGDGHLPV